MVDEVRVKTHVLQAICQVKGRLDAMGGITKDRSTEGGGGPRYKFRGIDDCYDVLCALTAQEGIVMMPSVVANSPLSRIEVTDRFRDGAKVGYQTHVWLHVEVAFQSPVDGSAIVGSWLGEAIDTSDKASNKAMSAAFKYACLQAFMIPVHGESIDTETEHVPVALPPKQKPKATLPPIQAEDGFYLKVNVPIPRPEGTAPTSNLDHIASTNTFGALMAHAEWASNNGSESATWSAISQRACAIASNAKDVSTLRDGKDLLPALKKHHPDGYLALTHALSTRFKDLQ